MADNVDITPGSGATVGADDVGGVLIQRVKMTFGDDGSATDVSATSPLPVDGSGVTQPISAVALPLPPDAATETSLAAAVASLVAIAAQLQATLAVSAASLPLPAGAATSAKQPALGTAGTAAADVLTVQGKAGMTPVLVDGTATTQPVSLASSPLPTGAATESTLALIKADVDKIPASPATDRATAAAPFSARLSDGTSFYAAPVAAQLPSSLGQKTAANSLGVVLASDQTLALPSGASTAAKQPALGTAGSASADVITVQGATGMTPLLVTPGGNVAHDAADSGSPIKIGAYATNALPTAVSNGDRANLISDTYGRLLIAHIDPAQQKWQVANYTSSQTGAAIWTPGSGKKIAITSIVLGSYGTTPARLILWFGASGDTTYTAGAPGTGDELVYAVSFAPSTSSKPGLVFAPPVPVLCATADYILRCTTDANLSVDIAVRGYEF